MSSDEPELQSWAHDGLQHKHLKKSLVRYFPPAKVLTQFREWTIDSQAALEAESALLRHLTSPHWEPHHEFGYGFDISGFVHRDDEFISEYVSNNSSIAASGMDFYPNDNVHLRFGMKTMADETKFEHGIHVSTDITVSPKLSIAASADMGNYPRVNVGVSRFLDRENATKASWGFHFEPGKVGPFLGINRSFSKQTSASCITKFGEGGGVVCSVDHVLSSHSGIVHAAVDTSEEGPTVALKYTHRIPKFWSRFTANKGTEIESVVEEVKDEVEGGNNLHENTASPFTAHIETQVGDRHAITTEIGVSYLLTTYSRGIIDRVSSSVKVSPQGLSAYLRFTSPSVNLSLPIFVSEQVNPRTTSYSTVVASALFAGGCTLMRWWRRVKRSNEKLNLRRRERIEERKKFAMDAQVAMALRARVVKRGELEKKGLVIRQAIYGYDLPIHLAFQTCTMPQSWLDAEENQRHYVDVTAPVQSFVNDSKLVLEGGSKAERLGFYDPHDKGSLKLPSKSRAILYVSYTYKESKYDVMVLDDQPLYLP